MKKGRRYFALLSLVMTAPYLMAASRYSPTQTYTDLSHTVEEITPEDYAYGRLYEFTLTNTGKGYVSYHEFFKYESKDYKSSGLQPVVKESIFKSELLIMPQEQFKLRHSTTSDFTNFETGHFYTYAYIDKDDHYDGPINFVKTENESLYLIDYEMNDLLSLRDYAYHFAVTINYDGQKYCLLCELVEDDKINFYVKEGFDASKAEILSIDRFRCEVYNGPNYGALAIGGALYVMIQMAIGSIILFHLIFIPILIHRIIRKKEMNNKQ